MIYSGTLCYILVCYVTFWYVMLHSSIFSYTLVHSDLIENILYQLPRYRI